MDRVRYSLPDHATYQRIPFELKIMAQFILHNFSTINEWIKTTGIKHKPDLENSIQQFVATCTNGETSNEALLQVEREIKDIIHCYNYHKRLNIGTPPELLNLKLLEPDTHPKLLPPPLPCDFMMDDVWTNDENAWVGHGYYWKCGQGEMCKDLSSMDYDMLEDSFCYLKKAFVLVADYQLLRKDFPVLVGLSDKEINEWLLRNAAYMSEGQVMRASKGGDMYDLIDVDIIDDVFDFERKKIGLRMKGGGRAASFFVDNMYGFNGERVDVQMLEVKGCGTTKHQPEISKKACGFLNLVDSLKEFAYQKLQQHICEKEKQNWSTVQYYAIIDTGIKFREDAINPATGYKADRCVLVIRQRQSRLVSSHDEVVFYSVARRPQQLTPMGLSMTGTLAKYGVSSEQLPLRVIGETGPHGDWNIQADATMSHMVDFSHWYCLPEASVPAPWRMSERALCDAFKCGGKFMNIFEDKILLKRLFNAESEQEVETAKSVYELQVQELADRFQEFGQIGRRKPDYSWSWFLEVDDSEVMAWASIEGT